MIPALALILAAITVLRSHLEPVYDACESESMTSASDTCKSGPVAPASDTCESGPVASTPDATGAHHGGDAR